MSTKKQKKATVISKVNTAIVTVKNSATKANEFALNTTEEIVLETISIASEWQKVTDKALKGGVKLMENQHNIVFDTLEAFKSQFLYGKKKISKVFA